MRGKRVPVEATDNRRLQRIAGQLRRELHQPFECCNRVDKQTGGQPAKALVAMSKCLPGSGRVVSAAVNRVGCRTDSRSLESVAESDNALVRCELASNPTQESQLFRGTTTRPHFIDHLVSKGARTT